MSHEHNVGDLLKARIRVFAKFTIERLKKGFNVKIKIQKIIKHSNIVRFCSMIHHLKDIDISKTAASKSRIPQNELIRVFDKSPTK